ncbi:helix-turn-helix transcriptional regulator [Enterovibrio norvegicus]|uniref:helix-turn-helix transcriptional regulator n=1 Tax=Enterovibrio norvegicus TaxID=188144 RepID=UPI0010BF016B|nr:AlpA family phage regulatory protein [Enterovibrio norvegicus]TKF31282.1 AlpA family phage regulatory protein [Enterovibrio norvegicus]
MNRILRVKEISELLGLSKSTIWRMRRDGLFPAPLKIGPRAVGWRESDVTDWIKSRDRLQ